MSSPAQQQSELQQKLQEFHLNINLSPQTGPDHQQQNLDEQFENQLQIETSSNFSAKNIEENISSPESNLASTITLAGVPGVSTSKDSTIKTPISQSAMTQAVAGRFSSHPQSSTSSCVSSSPPLITSSSPKPKARDLTINSSTSSKSNLLSLQANIEEINQNTNISSATLCASTTASGNSAQDTSITNNETSIIDVGETGGISTITGQIQGGGHRDRNQSQGQIRNQNQLQNQATTIEDQSGNHGRETEEEPTEQQLNNVATALGYINMMAAQESTITELRQLLERREQQIRTLQSQLDLYKRMFSFVNHGSPPASLSSITNLAQTQTTHQTILGSNSGLQSQSSVTAGTSQLLSSSNLTHQSSVGSSSSTIVAAAAAATVAAAAATNKTQRSSFSSSSHQSSSPFHHEHVQQSYGQASTQAPTPQTQPSATIASTGSTGGQQFNIHHRQSLSSSSTGTITPPPHAATTMQHVSNSNFTQSSPLQYSSTSGVSSNTPLSLSLLSSVSTSHQCTPSPSQSHSYQTQQQHQHQHHLQHYHHSQSPGGGASSRSTSSSLIRQTPLSPGSGSSAVASPLIPSTNVGFQGHSLHSSTQQGHYSANQGHSLQYSQSYATSQYHQGQDLRNLQFQSQNQDLLKSQHANVAPNLTNTATAVSQLRMSQVNSMQIKCKFGYLGSGRTQFNSPHGFCLGANQEIIVADTNNHRICVFDKNGQFMSQFGVSGKDEGQLWNPRKVAILPRSQLVAKFLASHPQQNSPTGYSSSSSLMTTSQGLDDDENENLLFVVCDRGAERSRMQLFTKDGVFIKKIGIQYIDIVAGLAITQDGLIIVVDSVSPTVYIISGDTGVLKGWFDCSNHMKEPSDIAVKSSDSPQGGNEYFICDFKGHCVVVFSESGEYLRKIGYDGLTSYPNGIDISDHGDILVGDSHGNRFHVVVFDKRGNLMSQFECPHVKVSRCCGLKITREGYIVTLAKNNHHVLILNTLFISSTSSTAA